MTEKLFTMTCGAGSSPLVLIHGWTCDHEAMLPVAEAFPNHISLLVDLLGHGRSPRSDSYAIERQAQAVLGVAPARAIWVGHSMGGQVALAAAAMAPDRVAGIVLLDPAFITPHEKARAFGESMRAQLARVDIPSMIDAFARHQFVKAADPAAVDRLVEVMRSTDPAVTRAAWDAVVDWDGRTTLEQVQCPVLLIAIDKPLNRPADLARINNKVMTAQVAGSGHTLQFEVMDQIKPMILRFLEINDLLIAG